MLSELLTPVSAELQGDCALAGLGAGAAPRLQPLVLLGPPRALDVTRVEDAQEGKLRGVPCGADPRIRGGVGRAEEGMSSHREQ